MKKFFTPILQPSCLNFPEITKERFRFLKKPIHHRSDVLSWLLNPLLDYSILPIALCIDVQLHLLNALVFLVLAAYCLSLNKSQDTLDSLEEFCESIAFSFLTAIGIELNFICSTLALITRPAVTLCGYLREYWQPQPQFMLP